MVTSLEEKHPFTNAPSSATDDANAHVKPNDCTSKIFLTI